MGMSPDEIKMQKFTEEAKKQAEVKASETTTEAVTTEATETVAKE